MALSFKINKAKYDALSDDMKGEYIAGDKDGEYVLDVSGLPEPEDVGPVKRALESEKNKFKETKRALDEARAKIAEMPDIDALNAQHAKDVAKYKTFTEKTLLDSTADSIAAKISNAPKLLAPHIKSRLVTDLSGDTPVTKVLGLDGKPSDLTIEALQQEFVANPDFKAIMIASKATGGGAPSVPKINLGGGGAPADDKSPDVSKLDGKAFAARIAERKAAEAQAS